MGSAGAMLWSLNRIEKQPEDEPAAHETEGNALAPVLYMALESSNTRHWLPPALAGPGRGAILGNAVGLVEVGKDFRAPALR